VQLLVVTLLVMPIGVLVLGAIAASLPGPAGASATRCPRFQPVAVRLHLGQRQQRLGVRRLGANTPFHNLMLGLGMLIGRFGYILPVLALAGSLAMKKSRTDRPEQLPDPRPAVRDPADRDHFAGRWPDLPADPGAGSDRRTPEHGFLRTI
jgi:K+-transporting ATPase ATPase A chain